MQALLEFLDDSPTPYQVVANAKVMLSKAGFKALSESDKLENLKSGKYYITRNESSIIAMQYNGDANKAFRIVGAHTDSPCLKLKPNALLNKNGYRQLAVDVYGGALLNPWFDRELALAGRITVKRKDGKLAHVLIDSRKPIAIIPSLAIHLDPKVNQGREINKQNHLPAVIECNVKEDVELTDWLMQYIAPEEQQEIEKILSHELSLYDAQKAGLIGTKEDILLSARLDNLLSCFAALHALCEKDYAHNTMIVLNDHEEVGSESTSGASGPFLYHVMAQLIGAEKLDAVLQKSFLISADNAHAIHPNYADKHEPQHAPVINAGPVIKINHNQRYATNSETEAVFKELCEQAGVTTQSMVVRADMACGSTIGPITATRLGVRTIDIGVPQLAMHSIREMAGAEDQKMLWQVLMTFFDASDETLLVS